jgi:DNA polymerase I-like protein with 3'-5' exonuclease and polymerase domains
VTSIITLDFETFYDRTFSLSKMTTEEYIRDELFETIGVGVKVDDGETQWFSGPKREIKAFLDQLPWDQSVAVAHNAMFDMAILNWHFDIRPKRIADTLSMARALHGTEVGGSLKALAEFYELGEKGTEVLDALGKGRLDFTPEELERYGEYCKNDVELTYKLFRVLAERFPVSELRLVDLTIRMFTEPVLELDKDVLTNHLQNVQTKKEKLMSVVKTDRSVLMSNPKLAELLMQMGVVPPQKISPATGKLTWAFGKTDEKFKALLDHPNPKVQAVVAARMGVKSTLEETRTERFIQIAERGTLPVPLRYYAAHTGRWGGDDKINLQNLPRKSPLKKAIRAPRGYVFIDCDSSQIEARTLAWLAGQDDLVEAFDAGEDVYKIMASAIYGVPVEEVTDDQRFVGKTTILGCGYGMGAVKFRAQLKAMGVELSVGECERIINVYRNTYPKIPELWKEGQQALMALIGQRTAPLGREGAAVVNLLGIRLPNGLYLKYPNLRAAQNLETNRLEYIYDTKKGRATIPTRIYGGKVIENVCQALARIVIGEQMLMVARRLRVVMTVHDAVGALAPEDQAGEARTFVEQCMRMRPKWALGLPLNCESKMGASYGG